MSFLNDVLARFSERPPQDPLPRMVEEITQYLLFSSHTWQSVQRIDRQRWARDLLADGITYVPHPWKVKTRNEVLVCNRLCEMMHDAARARAKEVGDRWGQKMHALQAHEIRDLRAQTDPLARRPYKGSKPRRYVNGQIVID